MNNIPKSHSSESNNAQTTAKTSREIQIDSFIKALPENLNNIPDGRVLYIPKMANGAIFGQYREFSDLNTQRFTLIENNTSIEKCIEIFTATPKNYGLRFMKNEDNTFNIATIQIEQSIDSSKMTTEQVRNSVEQELKRKGHAMGPAHQSLLDGIIASQQIEGEEPLNVHW